ncbi:histidine kinase dimerization/phosphoacceptor domain -containing protein [Gymnodinialimonas sp. 2305UL16-5]|uniref:sensor histidine kinase n=1 Tax=Gymnodinialimonas mytili TaxID=3126503 RepID=UPI0030B78647
MQSIEPTEIIATLRESLLVLTEDLNVEFASPQFFQTFEVDKEETIDRPLAELGNGQWNIPSLIKLLSEVLDQKTTVEDYEVDHVFEHIGRKVMRLNARKTVRPGNGSRRILLAIEDVTAASDLATELERERLLSTGIVDTIREPLLVLDERLAVISASRSFYATFNVEPQATLGRRLDDLGNGQWDIPELLDLLTNVIPQNLVVDNFEVRHVFPDIGVRVIQLNARKVYRQGNHTYMLLLAMQDMTDHRRLEQEREQALTNADRLLEELNHRVMNSLSMIAGIISMEARGLTDEAAQKALARMRARLDAVGSLYKTLSRSGVVDSVDARQYLSALSEDLVKSSGNPNGPELELDITPMSLSTRTAVPLGLVANELITNSLKYAYGDNGGGRLSVTMTNDQTDACLTISDNGGGINPEARVDSGLGQKLTAAFTTQLEGRMTTESDENGTQHKLVFPVNAL